MTDGFGIHLFGQKRKQEREGVYAHEIRSSLLAVNNHRQAFS